MSFNLAAIDALVVERLRTDPEGAAVRAALGAGLASIIHADALDRRTLPLAPFLAWRRLPVPLTERIVRTPTYTWWIYDEPGQLYARIDTLWGLILAAYEARRLDQATGGVIGNVDVGDGGTQKLDAVLQRTSSSINVYVYAG